MINTLFNAKNGVEYSLAFHDIPYKSSNCLKLAEKEFYYCYRLQVTLKNCL